MAKKKEKVTEADNYTGKAWINQAIGFGVFMYLINTFLIPFVLQEKFNHTIKNHLTYFVVFMLGGVLYGLTMKFYFERKIRKKKENS